MYGSSQKPKSTTVVCAQHDAVTLVRPNRDSDGLCPRCILGELFTKKPIFQANQELLQLELIR